MRLAIALSLCAFALSACEQCSPQPNVDVGVGVGAGGVSGGVSVGRQCGPVNFSVGTGDFWHISI